MLAYRYHEITKEYLGAQNAQSDPIEGGFLLPANCTFQEPPLINFEQVAVFENGEWIIRVDHRGHWQVKTDIELTPDSFSIVNYIGNPQTNFQFITDSQYNSYIEDNDRFKIIDGVFTDVSDTPEYTELKFQQAKEAKIIENDTKASETRRGQEFHITVQNKDCVFDTKAQTQMDLLTAFASTSSGLVYEGWITNNGITLDLTLEDVLLISTTFKELSDVYPQWLIYKEQIDEATTIEEIEAIEIIYGDAE